MKRVLILNADCYVGQHVARAFHGSREYEIDVTLSRHDDDTVRRVRQVQPPRDPRDQTRGGMTAKDMSAAATAGARDAPETDVAPLTEYLPSALSPYVNHVIPRHNDNPAAFCKRLLENDVIIAVLDDDSYDAECAIKVLAGSHYEVEKTFVLVSSALTWANTRMVDVARVRAERLKAREEEIAAFKEETEGEVDEQGQPIPLPEHLARPVDEAAELEIAEARVERRAYTEDEYATRVPHPRYQHWRLLEHLVKHANSQTLHTYVLFAGLPYGHGEGPLLPLLRAAWHQQSVQQFGPGDNVIPMIHVEDLANIAYKLGSAYDVYDERYLIAVDRGQLTQRELLHAVTQTMGGRVETLAGSPSVDLVNLDAATLPRPATMEELRARFGNGPSEGLRVPFFLSDLRLELGAAVSYHEEDDWVAVDGFAQNIHKVVDQFRVTQQVPPARLLVAGPPLSGKEGVAASLAAHYKVPFITAKAAVAAYQVHADEVREKLTTLLAARLQRRRDRGHARRVAEAVAEKARLREEAREARRQRRASRENGEDDAEDDEEAEGDDDDEADDTDDEERDEEDEESGGASKHVPLPMTFPEDRYTDVRRIVDRDRYVLGLVGDAAAAADIDETVLDYILNEQNLSVYRSEDGDDLDADADAEGELDDEENEEDDVDNGILEDVEVVPEEEIDPEIPRDEQGPSRAQARARLAIRRQDSEERAQIKSLRLEYALALKVLSMRLVNEQLPRPRPAREESADEEADDDVAHRKKAHGADDDDEDNEEEENAEDEEGGSDADDANKDDDDDEESDEDDDNADDDDATKAKNAAAAQARLRRHRLPPRGRYLDEAIAFMLRWRLRQVDCRNRGFVLLDFPRTVRQAYCLYYSGAHGGGEEDAEALEAETAERMAKRARPLNSEEDVIAPDDSDFPFLENFVTMDAETRRTREAELHKAYFPTEEDSAAPARALAARGLLDVLHKAGYNTEEEGLLASVSEDLFPTHLVLLREGTEVLQLRANAVSATITETFRLQLQYGTAKPAAVVANPNDGAATNSVAGSGTRVVKQLRHQQQQQQQQSPTEAGEWSFSMDVNRRLPLRHGAASTGPGASSADVAARRAMRLFQKLSAPLHRGLRDFQTQFDAVGSPTGSVLTWLQSVSTTPRLGATPAPVLAAKTHRDGGESGGDDDDGADGAAADRLEAPTTSRTIQIVQVQAPSRTTAKTCRELFTHCQFTEEVVPRVARELTDSLRGGNQRTQRAWDWLVSLAKSTSAGAAGSANGSGAADTVSSGSSSSAANKKEVSLTPAAMALACPYDYREATERLHRALAQLPIDTDVRAFLAELTDAQIKSSRAAAVAAEKKKKSKSSQKSTEVTTTTVPGAIAYPPLVLFTAQLCASLLRGVPQAQFGPPTRHPTPGTTVATASSAHETPRGGGGANAIGTAAASATTGLTSNAANTQSNSAFSLRDEERQEMEWLANLHAREQEEIDEARQIAMDTVKNERQALRSLQMQHECDDTAALQSMPMETYLMKYVLPSLTPAMTEVTRQRPEKPVTALADMLFQYKRRTEI